MYSRFSALSSLCLDARGATNHWVKCSLRGKTQGKKRLFSLLPSWS